MSESSGGGSTAILGVIIGAVLVIGLGYFFLGGHMGGGSKSIDVNIKPPAVSSK